MNKPFIFITMMVNALMTQATDKFITPYERSEGTETPTYQQVINYYHMLAQQFPQISLKEMGPTDSGHPLHIITYDPDAGKNKTTHENTAKLLINNGIHPGESDGIDATMMLFRDLATKAIQTPQNTIIVTIPVYNIGGSLNRNSTSRTNQNGPQEYGFRGNARNFDLNRDFIKNDTLNAQSFAEIFHTVKPDVFIDNHVSNGADYQYTLTHLMTQHNKLGGRLGQYLHETLTPALEKDLQNKQWDITPYVNVFNQVPESGFSQFMDYPRYSTGYTALFNVFGMMVETHMLKPYKKRVEGTYELMRSMISIVDKQAVTIKKMRNNHHQSIYQQNSFTLDWQIDDSKHSILDFKGYEAQTITSKVTGAQRLKYDKNMPFTKKVKYRNHFMPSVQVTIPKAYVIPQGWHNIIALLQRNNIEMKRLQKDQIMAVESYKISDYETRKMPYEGHYSHSKTQIESSMQDRQFYQGDYYISVNQPAIKYLLATLEPQAPDSFFNWNFFDSILQQKEHFSPYVFEDMAEQLLNDDPKLKKNFEEKRSTDQAFKDNWYAQLDWIHKNSEYYEKAHLQYPVYRVLK